MKASTKKAPQKSLPKKVAPKKTQVKPAKRAAKVKITLNDKPVADNATTTLDVLQPMPPVIEASERVVFEGKHVVAVLQDGRELRDASGKITHYHCGLEDGTTAHVPVTLFK